MWTGSAVSRVPKPTRNSSSDALEFSICVWHHFIIWTETPHCNENYFSFLSFLNCISYYLMHLFRTVSRKQCEHNRMIMEQTQWASRATNSYKPQKRLRPDCFTQDSIVPLRRPCAPIATLKSVGYNCKLCLNFFVVQKKWSWNEKNAGGGRWTPTQELKWAQSTGLMCLLFHLNQDSLSRDILGHWVSSHNIISSSTLLLKYTSLS